MIRFRRGAGARLLATLIAGSLLILARPSRAQAVADWRPFITEASLRFGIPAPWIERVMQAESAGRTIVGGRPIVSRAGAMGLMQLMPGTWAALRQMLGLGRDPFDPHDNIIAGTAYLRMMFDRFGYPGLFAAYNAGPGRYRAYLSGHQRLPGETVVYLGAVTSRQDAVPLQIASRAQPGLFAVAHAESEAPSAPDAPAKPGLFVVLSSMR